MLDHRGHILEATTREYSWSAFDDAAFDRKAWLAGFRATLFARRTAMRRIAAVHTGIGSFEEVAAMTEGEFLAIEEIDPMRLGIIREVLAEHGFDLRRLGRDRPEAVSVRTVRGARLRLAIGCMGITVR